uniref:Major facilitator superfamily (MFS) profile domain-containing protein n=1 Tax=Timema bartmani TaxID=61472 RepID=A0A7R9F9X3_9NEOP|nr:unnamed protein product [Timema bartmani]
MVAGMVASSHLWGYLADTRGRRKVLIATLLLDFLCAIAGSFAHTFWLFVVFRFLNGFFICGPSAVVYVYLGEFHTAEHRTKAIMWACIFISIGIISLPGLAWLVIPLKWSFDTPWFPYSSWRLFVALCGVPSLVTCIIMALFLPESPKFYQAIGQDEEALKALRYIYTVNKGNSPDKYPVKAIMSDPSQEDIEGEGGTSQSSGVFTSIWNQTAPSLPNSTPQEHGHSLPHSARTLCQPIIRRTPQVVERGMPAPAEALADLRTIKSRVRGDTQRGRVPGA